MKYPRCGGEAIEIVYGLPTAEQGQADEQEGRVILAGCLPGEDRWSCSTCGLRW